MICNLSDKSAQIEENYIKYIIMISFLEDIEIKSRFRLMAESGISRLHILRNNYITRIFSILHSKLVRYGHHRTFFYILEILLK